LAVATTVVLVVVLALAALLLSINCIAAGFGTTG
jgi:hypothetical protein